MTDIQILGVIFVFLGHVFWLINLSKSKINKMLTYLIYLGVFIFTTLMCIVLCNLLIEDIDKAISLMFIVAFLLYFIVFLILSEGIFLKNLFLFITYSNFFCITHNLSFLLVEIIFDNYNTMYHFIGLLIRLFFNFGGLLLYLYFIKSKIQKIEVDNNKQWLPMCISGVLFFCILAIWTALGTNVWNYTIKDNIIFILLLIVTIGLYIVIFYTIYCMNTIYEFNLIKQQSRYLQEKIKNYEMIESSNRRLRHDIRHHLLNISIFLHKGNIKEALKYIKEYDNEILDLAPRCYSKHMIINNILSAYAIKFKENSISFEVYCNIPENIAIKDVDLISLLGNLLENALNGCKECESLKKTEIYLKIQNNKLIIVCENSCSDKLELDEDIPKNKGVGISSMKYVCDQYNGHIGYSLNNGICSVCIVLNLINQ